MKKVMMVLLCLTAVGFIFFNIANAKSENDLFKMAAILQKENIDIDKWSLHAREEVKTGQTEARLSQLMKQHPNWNWNITENQEKWEATGVSTLEHGMKERISIVSSDGFSFLIYEVNGNGWNAEIKDLVKNSIIPKIDDIFQENTIIFSCIYSELDGKMYKSVSAYVTKLLQSFQAEEVETLKENNFVSTSAYSPLFSESIKGQTEEMNLQLGLRNQGLGGKTTLVVGTPIITIEY